MKTEIVYDANVIIFIYLIFSKLLELRRINIFLLRW